VQGASQHFVAIARGDAGRATFVPYSEHFVARARRHAEIATKCALAALPSRSWSGPP
jgi:hypothetical protein